MRSMLGWRFCIYIALPLLMATLATINLSYDLLRNVETSSNSVEHQRNKTVLGAAVAEYESDVARVVAENAMWDEAVLNTTGKVNDAWFEKTWARSLSMGAMYDTVAVIDANSGAVLAGSRMGTSFRDAASIFGTHSFETYKTLLANRAAKGAVVSGFLTVNDSYMAVAMAPIASPKEAPFGNQRLLYFSKRLQGEWLEGLQHRLAVGGLALGKEAPSRGAVLALKSPFGEDVAFLRWDDRQLGNLLTSSSWGKAALVLGFLVLVLTGIAFVVWKLLEQLVDDESKAQHNAQHDHLTSLPNRLALTMQMARLDGLRQNYALAFADLDGFKEVNDSYGHEFGDRLIVMIANGIERLAGDASLCCRLGGDEFVVLFEGELALENAKTYATRLIAMLKQPFDMDGRLASVGASIGLSQSEQKHNVTEMLRRSDIAMYRAKTSGKNRYCVFDETFDFERTENLAIASELKSILASRNLDIVFQPVVDAKTAEIKGLEALARWPSTSSRHVPADKFIAIAESSGLIDALGELILEKACVHAANWPGVRLAVNISAVQLNNPGFVQRSLGVLAQHGIEANRVEFEITETSLINDAERAKQVFKSLQQAGIKIALDDFGTGFSSIGYLRTFKFDRIKIDKSIVNKVLSSASELAVVQGTLLVARGLSAEVTAEGVESAEEASVLHLAGCTELQGYLYYKPMAASDVTETLRRKGMAKVPRTLVRR